MPVSPTLVRLAALAAVPGTLLESVPTEVANRIRQSATVVMSAGGFAEVSEVPSIPPAVTSHGLPEVIQPEIATMPPQTWSTVPDWVTVGATSEAGRSFPVNVKLGIGGLSLRRVGDLDVALINRNRGCRDRLGIEDEDVV